MPTVERLTEKDTEEILRVLNESFSHKEVPVEHPHQSDFEKSLPIMWTGEHDYASRHLGIRENGKIVALLGVYPLRTVVAGAEVLMGTIGNVATLPEARGKGYMKQLVTAALDEAQRMGFVAARLGGLRSRYNRYLFDHAGSVIRFTLTQRNAKEYPHVPACRFDRLRENDAEGLSFARKYHERSDLYVVRETDMDFFCTLRAWEGVPYLAVDEKSGNPVGYVSITGDGNAIIEWGTDTGFSAAGLAAAWLREHPQIREVTFEVMPHDTVQLEAAYACCEEWKTEAPSMFRVFQWDRMVQAFMKLAEKTTGLADGELTVGIRDWGNLEIRVTDGTSLVSRTEEPAQISFSALEAIRFFFGDPWAAVPDIRLRRAAGWFPLPLSWNGQDRV